MGLVAVVVAGLLSVQVASTGGGTHVLIVSGVGGEPQFRDAFHNWGVAMADAAKDRFGVPEEHVVFLAENPQRDPRRIHARSTKENLVLALDEIAQRAQPADLIFILLIGHGSGRGAESRFNLPGPDMTAAELSGYLVRFPTQTLVFANASSASGDFLGVLSGPNRVVITATTSGFERNESVFGGFFVEAFTNEGADADKDQRVSIFEAFDYARREVVRRYERENLLLSEHALIDDDGDGEGTAEPGDEGDGALARRLFLDGHLTMVAAASPDDSALVALYSEKQELEEQIALLRNLRGEMDAEAYEDELEELLVRLAGKNRAIREREEGR